MLLQAFSRVCTRKPCWSLTGEDVLQMAEKRRGVENMEVVVERHPNTAGSSPQSVSAFRSSANFKGGRNYNFL